jgi:hypothetical protein
VIPRRQHRTQVTDQIIRLIQQAEQLTNFAYFPRLRTESGRARSIIGCGFRKVARQMPCPTINDVKIDRSRSNETSLDITKSSSSVGLGRTRGPVNPPDAFVHDTGNCVQTSQPYKPVQNSGSIAGQWILFYASEYQF